MPIRRFIAATISGVFFFVVGLPATAAGDPRADAADAALWGRLEAQLELVLRQADPAWSSRPAALGWARGGDLAMKVDAVVADWRARRRQPEVMGGTSAAPPVPEQVFAAVQRIAGNLHRARRLARGREGAARAVLTDTLSREVRDLRLMVAKQRGRMTTSPSTALATSVAPDDDACSSATPIGDGTFSGTTDGATNDGSSACGASGSAPDVWFLYTAASDTEMSFDTFGSGYDTVLSLHSGCPGTTANEIACNDDTLGLQSKVSLSMTSGQQVWVRVSGYGGQTGTFVLNAVGGALISGTVTDSATAAPLQDVLVVVYDELGAFVDLAWSASDGRFATGPLLDGEYFAIAWSETHRDELYRELPCSGGCAPADGTAITVGGGANSSGVDFTLDPGGSISGTATLDSSGQPLAGVGILVFDAAGSFETSSSTVADGSYTVAGLPAGTHYAWAHDFEHLGELYDDLPCPIWCDFTTGQPIVVSVGADTPGIDFTLELGGAVAGLVTDAATGSPLDDVQITLHNVTFGFFQSVSTKSDGTYRTGGLPSETYFARTTASSYPDELYDDIPCNPFCNVSTGTPIPVVEGSTTEGIDFVLGTGLSGSVAGTVREAGTGTGLAAVRVTAYDDLGRPQVSTLTAGDGSYFLSGMPGATIRLLAGTTASHASQLSGSLPFGLDVLTGAPIALDTAVTGLDFELPPLGACGFPESLAVSSVAVDSVAEYAACGTLTAGPQLTVGGSGRLALRAGGAVTLRSGLAIENGGRLAVASGSHLPPAVGRVVYREDFEDGFALGWDSSHGATDLWRVDAACPKPTTGARTLSFSRSTPDCDYELAGTVPVGWARSPIVDLSAAPTATLHLEHWWETESGGFFDAMRVEASGDGGATWTSIWTTDSGTPLGVLVHDLDVSAFATSAFRVRFVFDSRDGVLDDFAGWHLDELSVTAP